MNTSVSSAWTSNSPSYIRYNGAGSFYYESFNINVSTAGSYVSFSGSRIDTYGYLYSPSFSPWYPAENLVAFDDDRGGNGQFRFTVYLRPNVNYILVATTYSSTTTGAYNVTVSGLTSVDIIRNNQSFPQTSRPSIVTRR